MKTKIALILVAAALSAVAIAQPRQPVAAPDANRYAGDIYKLDLDKPLYRVELIHEAQVPGQEAGVLVELNVVEGDYVKAGQVLGRIDDTQPRMQGLIATEEHKAALEKVANDVDVRYAMKATELALVEWQKSVEVNKNQPMAVADIDVRRQKLTWERGKLETERAESERKIAGFTAAAKRVEIDAALEAMKRREIRSPVDGRVVQVHLHKGEWVKPGDPVLHVVQLDRLKVEGEIEIARYSPSQVMGRPVAIEATLQDRKVQFVGKITFVRPLLDGLGRKYLVNAEVVNREEHGEWLLLPGLYVDMKIDAAEARLTKSK
jgi:multidrug efflux pump subunit AcrA (membrane-fusion protein)